MQKKGGLIKVQGWASWLRNRDAALRHITFTEVKEVTIFSRYPAVLQLVIIGVVGIIFELVKYG